MEERYVRVPIYPVVRYLTPKESRGRPTRKDPVEFMLLDDTITTRTLLCERGVARKAGGRGFRFLCAITWGDPARPRTKESILWHDDFYDDWFIEVPESWAARHGLEYEQYSYSAEKNE